MATLVLDADEIKPRWSRAMGLCSLIYFAVWNLFEISCEYLDLS